MPTLKYKEIKKMDEKEMKNKLNELKIELLKAKAQSAKGGTAKIKEIKKIGARIQTFENEKRKQIKLNKPKSDVERKT